MDKRLCLDTDVCIEILKNSERIKKLFETESGSQIFVSTITIFELLLRKTNLNVVEDFLNLVNKLPVDENVARLASILFKDLKDKNTTIEIRDLFIAACTIANDCYLATFNKKDFSKIKGIRLIEI